MIIEPFAEAEFRIRDIDEGDIEDLRQWKNQNRQSFFLKEEVTPEQQAGWFTKFRERDDDRMFVVEQKVEGNWLKIGCMGFRVLEEEGCVDAYNIIRSRKLEPANFVFADPFKLMLAYAGALHPEMPIQCKVLSGNPAVEWYERNGFSKKEEREGFFLMELDKNVIDEVRFTENSEL